MKKLLKKLRCLIIGHYIIPVVTKKNGMIYTTGCKRCNKVWGIPYPKPHEKHYNIKK